MSGPAGNDQEKNDKLKDDRGNEPKQVDEVSRNRREKAPKLPPAGPHDRPDLTNDEATPGAGTLPPPEGEPDDGGSVSS